MKTSENQFKAGIVLNYVNMGIGTLIPIFYTPVMLRVLGQEEYGLYKLSSVATSYLGLVSLGLGSAITRYLTKANIEGGQPAEERMLALFLIIFRTVALVALFAGVCLVLNLNVWYSASLSPDELKKMQLLVMIMVINTAFSFSVSPYMSVVTAREKYVFFQCMSILSTCVVPFLCLIVLFLGFASVGLALCSLGMSVLIRVIYYWYVKNKLGIRPCYEHLPTHCLKEIFMFSFWIFVANVVSRLYASTDTMMIGAIPKLAVVGVAIYNIGIVFDRMISGISLGVSNLLQPRINKMVFSKTDSSSLTDFSIKVGRIQCYMATFFVACFAMFGKPLIHYYVGDRYMDAYWVTLVIAVPKLIVMAQSACLSIIIAKNQHRFRSLVYLAVAVGNVIGTWLVLNNWGIIGAAAVTGLSFIMGHGFCMNWYYWKHSGIDIARFWRQVLQVFLIPVVVCMLGIAMKAYINLYNIWTLLFSITIFSLLLGVLQWFLVFNDYEKKLFIAPFRKLMRVLCRYQN